MAWQTRRQLKPCARNGHKQSNARRKGAKEKTMNNGLIRRSNNSSLSSVFDNLFAPTSMIEKVFGDMFDDGFFKPNRWAKESSVYPMNVVNVKKDGKTVAKRLEYALAGFSKDEIKLSLKNDILTIEAEHNPVADENETTEYNGISYKKMTLSYSLMDNADQDGITNKFSNGLLSITIPLKKEEDEPADGSKYIDIE